jgi:hypothetical protein
MSLQSILLFIHSWVRWLVLLAGVVAIVLHLVGLIQRKADYEKPASISMSAFSGLIDLNVTIGIIQLIAFWKAWSAAAGGFPFPQIEHLTTMLVAAVVAHLPSMLWKDKPAGIRYRNTLIAVVLVILLIIAGIMPLVGNRWVFRGL